MRSLYLHGFIQNLDRHGRVTTEQTFLSWAADVSLDIKVGGDGRNYGKYPCPPCIMSFTREGDVSDHQRVCPHSQVFP